MELANELKASLREFAGTPCVEVRENGGRVATLNALSWEVRGATGKPLLHLWSDRYNLTRRVLAITDHSQERLALAVERFGRTKPDRLEFIRVDFDRSARDISRDEFCERLSRILAEQFPDEILESLTISPDLEHSLSGNYARGIFRRGSARWTVLAVPSGESAEVLENSLSFALLWLDHVRQSCHRGTTLGGRLILPAGTTSGVMHRIRSLHPKLAFEVYELDLHHETVQKIDKHSSANRDTWLVPHRETQLLLNRAEASLESIVSVAPRAISLHAVVKSQEVWLRFRGLSFARWSEGKVFFGAGDPREKLTPDLRPALKQLLRDLELYRAPLGTDTRNPLYRLQPERWLESIVREDVTRIDPTFDPRFVYSQVFANSGTDHGILDVLTVTRNGRLAILELKATEHLHLPLQAADYWLRIKRHLEEADFQRCGYFVGTELQMRPPLVVLVAPALRFHPVTDTLLRCLTPELEVIRVGLAESWRRGIRVVMRH